MSKKKNTSKKKKTKKVQHLSTEDIISSCCDSSSITNNSNSNNVCRNDFLKKKKKKTLKSILKQIEPNAPKRLSNTTSPNKCVKFDKVYVREFDRVISYSVVPGDGSWPLGLGTGLKDELAGDIDVFEERRQEELRERYEKHHHAAVDGGNSGTLSDTTNIYLETRQYDFRRRCKNPLFLMKTEGERMDLLLDALDPDHHHEKHRSSDTSKNHHNKDHHHQQRPKRNRPRGLSKADLEEMKDGHVSGVAIQKKLEHECIVLRNELETIKQHRLDVGCTCKKRKHFNKLSEKRIRDELKKRNLDHINGTKEERLARFKAAVEAEPCCDRDCPCVKVGLNCQADLCSCWYADKKVVDDDCKANYSQRCGNSYGIYLYDRSKIDRYRMPFLLCKEVGTQ